MPTATIDLAALAHNARRLKSYLAPNVLMLAAVKANAYGHGLVAVSKRLEREGARWFGVATAEEALALREAGLGAGVLILGPVYEGIEGLIERDLALTVTDERALELAGEAARRVGKQVRVHLKVDTGMGRLGRPAAEALGLVHMADRHRQVFLEGLWTHLACADEEGNFTACQLETFGGLLAEVERAKVAIPLVHAANSAGLIACKEAHFSMVRPGIALYGYHSSALIAGLEPHLRPVMTLTAPVTFVKRVRAGTPVSYGCLWQAPRDTQIATVRLGYADGYPRVLSGKARVLVRGRLRPVVGRICMDQLMVDVGDLDVEVGERVTFFGREGLDAEEVGRLAGTISYEILASVGQRVKRLYRGA
jgi:alanine racemase